MICADPTTPKKKRITPTQRQLTAAALLSDTELLDLSVRALHALNRRAKEKRDREQGLHWNTRAYISEAIRHEIARIYSVKTTFLDRLVQAGLAKVESFDIEGRHHTCCLCGRSWVGDDYCYECDDDSGEPAVDTWYIVEACGHRFHQPPGEATAAMREVAVAGEAHGVRRIVNVRGSGFWVRWVEFEDGELVRFQQAGHLELLHLEHWKIVRAIRGYRCDRGAQ